MQPLFAYLILAVRILLSRVHLTMRTENLRALFFVLIVVGFSERRISSQHIHSSWNQL